MRGVVDASRYIDWLNGLVGANRMYRGDTLGFRSAVEVGLICWWLLKTQQQTQQQKKQKKLRGQYSLADARSQNVWGFYFDWR